MAGVNDVITTVYHDTVPLEGAYLFTCRQFE